MMTCKGCGFQDGITDPKEALTTGGWLRFASWGGSVYDLCPHCAARYIDAVRRLLSIVPDNQVYLGSITLPEVQEAEASGTLTWDMLQNPDGLMEGQLAEAERFTDFLHEYIEYKLAAYHLRLEGNIRIAQMFERTCDEIYETGIPTQLKW